LCVNPGANQTANGEDSLREGFQVPAFPRGASCLALISIPGCYSEDNDEDLMFAVGGGII
jgi:hypothetical protein